MYSVQLRNARVDEIISTHRRIVNTTKVLHVGHTFAIHPNVFSPFIAPSGRAGLSFAALPIFAGKRILDLGCGSGVIACMMALSGAKQVVGVDINPAAIENATENLMAFGLHDVVEIRKGDLFSPIGADEKFDLIWADLPFADGSPQDMLEAAFYDTGLRSIRELIKMLPFGLAKNGSVYLCVSNLESTDFLWEPSDIFETHLFMKIALEWIDLNIIELRIR